MDIHNKEFDRSFRGYHEDQVDQFLDKIVEEYERMYKENLELKEKIAALGDQLSQYKTLETTLKETLVTAQKTAEEVTAAAHRKSELIQREGEAQVRKMLETANGQVVEVQREYEEHKRRLMLFKAKIRTLLETQMEMIRENIEGEPQAEETEAVG
jgi:cell division initiation protein